MKIAPCVDKCPIGLPIPDYIRKTASGRLKEAYYLIAKEACIPSILGRICFHPCEDACRRADIDEAISICNIKRFLGDNNFSLPKQRVFQREKVGIVGGGPAGLSCAFSLLQLGYKVDIFEEKESAGGMPYIAIPLWRLPFPVLKKDIENLIKAGLSIKTNTKFGRDFGLDYLKREYDAIVIATGLPLSRGINEVSGKGVILALEFLSAIKFNKPISLGKNVLVIGGGNVAMDCARAVLRLGRNVSLVCLEDYENMPCFKEEKISAKEEGVKLFPGFGPKELIRENGKIRQLKVMKVLSLFDKNNKFSPKFDENETKTIDCDTVIMAIGQMADLKTLEKEGINPSLLKEEGFNNVFACGDIVLGPSNAASSIASGKRCARFIHYYFKKGKIEERRYEIIQPFPKDVIPRIVKSKRIKEEKISLKERISSFNEIEKTYTLENAFLEAGRCLYCGNGPRQEKEFCPLCLTCIRLCPLGGIKREERRAMPDPCICQGCGICASFCPDNAIRVDWFFKEKYPKELTIACFDNLEGNALRVRCLLSLGIPFLLSLLNNGVERISIKPCKDSCFVPSCKPLVSKMIDRFKRILKEIGYKEAKCIG